MTRTIHLLFALGLAALPACSGEPEGEASAGAEATAPDSADSLQGRTFERNIVFLSTRGDSTLLVPWFLTAHTRPGGVDRTARAWLARGGSWEPFLVDAWESPPTRNPWRIVPHGSMRLLVGDEDALDRIVFAEGPRQLEVLLRDALVEWGGPRGEAYRLLEASLLLSSERVEGLVLDASRVLPSGGPRGDGWAFLTSGDSLQVVLTAPSGEVRGAMRGWARLDFRELQWPEVVLEWSETRAFERARRDVPVAWTLTSPDGEVEGALEVHSAHIEAGEGEGPQLPVDALFEVSGTLTVEGRMYPVRGLVRHAQQP